jgi:hypothetical protein
LKINLMREQAESMLEITLAMIEVNDGCSKAVNRTKQIAHPSRIPDLTACQDCILDGRLILMGIRDRLNDYLQNTPTTAPQTAQ